MSQQNESTPPPALTPTQWLICIIAAIGFAFDTYELLMAPIILRPALVGIGGLQPGSPAYLDWASWFFYLPAVFGGIFGLLGGYLTDYFGRRRVLVWSILLYAFSALAAGFSTSLPMLLALRCTTMIGVCVEFVAAVAWLAELFPHPKQKEMVLGWTQAFSSVGGLMVTGAYHLAVDQAQHFPPVAGGHDAWRYTLISGVIPALPLILIRPFLPESPDWQAKKQAGTLRRPSIVELFQPALRRTTIVTTLIMACGYAAAFGALQQAPRIVPDSPQVVSELRKTMSAQLPELQDLPPQKRGPLMRALGPISQRPRPLQAAAVRNLPEASDLPPDMIQKIIDRLPALGPLLAETREKAVTGTQFFQEVGGLAGRVLLAILAVFVVSRRGLLWVFQIPGLILIPLIFYFPARTDLEMFRWGIFLAGMLTIGQFSFWGNYLPRAYPVHLRGTGESFAANIGGRLIGTSAALITIQLTKTVTGESEGMKLAVAAGIVALAVYLIGFIASFWLPELKPATDQD